jgi:dienelactone hydrolase
MARTWTSCRSRWACAAAALLIFGSAARLRAEAPRVLPAGSVPSDRRLEKPKDYDGYFPFTPSKSPEEWAKRGERVRRQVLVANGLWPMPTKTPPSAVVHGKVQRAGYTVEKVYFESYPGLYVTGNLYRPAGKSGRLPAVLCPHGHWPNGRFMNGDVADARKQITEGAERFENGGRFPLQARCAQLARMGCVVFSYDMLGYADSVQIPFELAHRYAKVRPQFDTPENWGLFSTQAELRQQSVMGIQTYNSIRALDWLAELPDVDPARIGVTGSSGGGTQTFVLTAIDSRPAVGFPAVMVSTAMQGGCTCENCCLLRVETGNIELAALTAPRPLGMTAADDWTKEIMTKGFPELKQHYALLGVPDNVLAKALLQFGHNYNFVSREVMYQWFNKQLRLGLPEPVIEEDFVPLSAEELSVWDAKHPKPAVGGDFERSLLKWITQDSDQQMAALTPADKGSLAKYRTLVGGAVDVIVGRELPAARDIEYEMVDEQERGDYMEFTALLRYKPAGEELPIVFLHPNDWKKQVVIWAHGAGKGGVFAADGQPIAEVRKLLAAGVSVAAPDLLFQGEFLSDGKPLAEARRVDNPREFVGYTLGYNHALGAQRAHDILTVISFVRSYSPYNPEKVYLLATAGAAPWGAMALAQSRGAVDRAALDTAGFRFTKLTSIFDVNFVPGVAKYGDLPGLLSLAAPTELWLAGEGTDAPPIVSAAYHAGGEGSVTAFSGSAETIPAAAIEWLLR